ncbi:MAG TPA: class A beta-lactamase-related serine hydrolase [Ginsengibacter sp.]|nr:class A beta-lactamase-related serine hydrolase [Ginsengibacter sp.]HRP17124.1 class A beta-lactamase-related serine hydrolase [Ginsengibacter sp.]HRP45047.1 class A beta-lactamase-related serine hydrolase [Ginsengibacter sp.]
MNIDELRTAVNELLGGQDGTFAIAYHNLGTGEELLISADTIFHAASTMKTPVMMEVFRQAREGRFSLQDSVKMENRFKSIVDSSEYQLNAADDSDTAIYNRIGTRETIYNLTVDMIIKSSNLATNMIIQLVGAKNVMQHLEKLQIENLHVLRGVEDQKAYDLGMNNTTSARALMKLFIAIATNKAGTPDDCAEMIKILKMQEHNRVIPALLPEAVTVAHKTGNITGVEHDSGIIILPDGKKYVLVILSKNLKDEDSAIQSMAQVSKLIYDYFVGQTAK